MARMYVTTYGILYFTLPATNNYTSSLLEKLPVEVKTIIASYCDPADIIRLALTGPQLQCFVKEHENHVAKRLVLHAIERELISLAMTTHVVAEGPLKTYPNVYDNMRHRIVKVFSTYDPTCRQSISETLCRLRLYDATEMIQIYRMIAWFAQAILIKPENSWLKHEYGPAAKPPPARILRCLRALYGLNLARVTVFSPLDPVTSFSPTPLLNLVQPLDSNDIFSAERLMTHHLGTGIIEQPMATRVRLQMYIMGQPLRKLYAFDRMALTHRLEMISYLNPSPPALQRIMSQVQIQKKLITVLSGGQ
ncbi:hypothetical protein F4778DRAFT_785470 [Xylariomycetidae sp. FL2044]|nr:hypothetical protein F4778DRAFT_785470 [Xylariomycetidae sp. FL2044]